MKDRLRALLGEPLVHFMLLGAALFLAYDLVGARSEEAAGSIVVTQGRIESLSTVFARSWSREPTAEELDGLIREYVREEAATRQAITLGLDKDDTVIRRRLRQKLEFVAEELATPGEPTADDLRAYLKAHPGKFAAEPRFTFSQVHLDPQRRGAGLARDVAELRRKLDRAGGGAELSALGDSRLLERRFNAISRREVARIFGEEFAARLVALAPGVWQGPIESGYGVHLVFVHDRLSPALPDLAEVREEVRRELLDARREESVRKFYEALLRRYTVTVEKAAPGNGEAKIAQGGQ